MTICLTCFSRYFVLQHCKSRSHLTLPEAWVWPVSRRKRPKFSAKLARSFPVNSGRLTTILDVATALASLECRRRLFLFFFFFFFPSGWSGSSGSSSSEGEADVREGGSLSEGSPPRSLEPYGSTSTIARREVSPSRSSSALVELATWL